MKDYEEKALNIVDSIKFNIMAQLNKAYKSGYEDAKSELGKNAIDLAHEESNRAYQQGLADAWEAARKIILDKKGDTGLSLRELVQIFNTASTDKILKENTASEAIANIKEYEEQQKQDAIQVGDEVTTRFGKKGVVITNVPCEDGNICVWFPTCTHVQMYPVKDLSKTGRTFPQIAEVLKEMRGDKE